MFIPKTARQADTNRYKHMASRNIYRPSTAISRDVVNKEKHNIG